MALALQPRQRQARRPLLKRAKRSLEPMLGFAALLVLWQLGAQLARLPQVLLPSPLDVGRALWELYDTGILYEYVLLSLGHYLAGVAIGAVVGVVLGLAIASNRLLAELTMPLVNFTYAIVEVAWIPLLILWWGFGAPIVITAVAYVVASPLVHNLVSGVRSIPPVYGRAVRSLGGDGWTVVREVTLPAMLPPLFNGIRIGAGFGFRALIFGEMIAQTEGIGYLIFTSAAAQQTARTIAGMIVMGCLWLALDRLYLRPLEQASIERWGLAHDEAER